MASQSLLALGSTPLVFLQHLFTEEIYQAEFNHLLTTSHVMADRARLLSISSDLGALWLSAIPSQPRFRMSCPERRCVLRCGSSSVCHFLLSLGSTVLLALIMAVVRRVLMVLATISWPPVLEVLVYVLLSIILW